MNSDLAATLTEIHDIAHQIAALCDRSKSLRLSLNAYYTALPKHSDGITGLVFLSDLNRIAYVKPFRKDATDPKCKIEDYTVTYDECVVANQGAGQ